MGRECSFQKIWVDQEHFFKSLRLAHNITVKSHAERPILGTLATYYYPFVHCRYGLHFSSFQILEMANLQTLPDEVPLQITEYLSPSRRYKFTRDLHGLCLCSRRFYQINRNILYGRVPLC